MSNKITIKKLDKQVPNIIILWDDGTQLTVPVLSLLRGVTHKGKRPTGFWYEPNQPTYGVSREAFMEWMHTEFIHIFDQYSDVFNTHLPILDYRE